MDEEKQYLLAGPLENENDEARFNAAKNVLEQKKIKAISPMEVTSEIAGVWEKQENSEPDWETYFVGLVANLMYFCDGIILLSRWEEAKEARALKSISEICGKETLYFDEILA